jgi:hypothetical protein
MARKKISTNIYITPEQNELLKVLNQKTKVPVAEDVRPGIESPSGPVQVAASWSGNLR